MFDQPMNQQSFRRLSVFPTRSIFCYGLLTCNSVSPTLVFTKRKLHPHHIHASLGYTPAASIPRLGSSAFIFQDAWLPALLPPFVGHQCAQLSCLCQQRLPEFANPESIGDPTDQCASANLGYPVSDLWTTLCPGKSGDATTLSATPKPHAVRRAAVHAPAHKV